MRYRKISSLPSTLTESHLIAPDIPKMRPVMSVLPELSIPMQTPPIKAVHGLKEAVAIIDPIS